MRWLRSLVSLTLLIVGCTAAKRSSEKRYTEYHTKSLSSSPIKLDDVSYKDLTAVPRDYTVVVLLTAMESRFGCQLCREFQPEWDLLAHSWVKGDKAGESRVIFSTLDFNDGRNIFLELGLQTAPVLLLFPPTTGPHASPSADPLRYDFTGGSQSAEQVHSWLSRNTPDRPHPTLKRPINWMRLITSTVLVLGLSTALYAIWPQFLAIVQNRNVWAAVSLVLILLFTSGHMFNHIRKVPYVAANGRGGISYFAGGFQSQFGMETQIIAALYGLLAFAAISLAVKVPRISDPKQQQVAVLAWGGALLVLYSFLLSVFRIKNGGYPFALPPFM